MQSLSLEIADKLLTAACTHARSAYAKPVCVAVCDAFGFLIVFRRMDGAPVRSIQLAQQKAYTCTRMGTSTVAFLERLRADDVPIGFFCDPLLTALPGGALLADAHGRVLGAIGVSGLAPADDQALAEQVAARLLGLAG
ncbi:heme-binding protein [Trinickia violacea]|uniref:Heme-binding protein n=1 Tax=Trinickia violacea TaxID=2571746 RepID=A0A4V1EHY6_9BURK|nr:heme-binding protein [Trinickia violacea]QCP51900.1 heme-binding protein [Trinickia violacea]